MWLMTTSGYYSVVQHREDPELVLVRARVRADLENLEKFIPGLSETLRYDATADYPHRMVMDRAVWMSIVTQLTLEVDYDNFKSAVGRADPERAHVYHNIWYRLTDLEPDFWDRYYPASVFDAELSRFDDVEAQLLLETETEKPKRRRRKGKKKER